MHEATEKVLLLSSDVDLELFEVEPDPKGPLSLTLPSHKIALANSEVTKATQDSSKKRGQYKNWVPV